MLRANVRSELMLQLRDELIQRAQFGLQRANGAPSARNTRGMTAVLTPGKDSTMLAQPRSQFDALVAEHSTEVGGLPDRWRAVSASTPDYFCLTGHERHSSHRGVERDAKPEKSYSTQRTLTRRRDRFSVTGGPLGMGHRARRLRLGCES